MKRFPQLLILFVLAACHPKPEVIPAENFQTEVDGQAVGLYTLSAGDITVQLTNYGARVVSLFAPDRDGRLADVVTGCNTLEAYSTQPGARYFGCVIGPVANRIGGASFVIDGVTYHTVANSRGNITSHGGPVGLDRVVWEVTKVSKRAVSFHYLHKDGQEGFPGNLDITVTYKVTRDNALQIEYSATTDAATPVNLSNHTYFCLNGEGAGTVEDYRMWIKASHLLAVDEMGTPTGEVVPVEGTPFDFREVHAIGERIGADDDQIRKGRGYDHNWCFDKEKEGVELVCRVQDPASGRTLEVLTDQPGMQFYSGNYLSARMKGKNGQAYGPRCALALETQGWPDAMNHENFPSILLRPDGVYSHTCIYRFSAE